MTLPKHLRGTIALALLGAMFGAGQVRSAESAAAIEQRIRGDIGFLASDDLEGRGIDTKGIAKAADYIRDQFQSMGLKSGVADGSYFQPFNVIIDSKIDRAKSYLALTGPDGKEVRLELDKQFQPINLGGPGKFKAPVVFAGYGITAEEEKYDDFKDLDVAGKVVLVIRREPQQADEKSVFDGKDDSKHAAFISKLQNAWANKAVALLMVNDPFTAKRPDDDKLVTANYFGSQSSVGLPAAHITQQLANQLLASTQLRDIAGAEAAIDKDGKPKSQALKEWTAEGEFAFNNIRADLNNVVGVVEGEGPTANETIVLGAHYDHLGFGGPGSRAGTSKEIHNGADDNASGTSALLELARRFASRNTKPSRRLVFIAFSAEERGLLGSQHYVKKSPLFPLKDTVAMFNFDMVGRLTDDGLVVHGSQTAKEFEPLLDDFNTRHKFKLKKVAGGDGPSDHSTFYRENLPVLFFFTGSHKDYHRPSDDVDKINLEGVRRVVAFAEELVDAVLAEPKRPSFVKVKNEDPHAGVVMSGGKMAYLGTIPDYGEETDGVLLNDVSEGSPAAKGGLLKNDIIISIGTLPIKNVNGLTFALHKHKPGDVVEIVVLRGKEKKSLKVTLGTRSR